ncbi:MAG: hypothetical protein COC23_03645 [Hyphomicrobiales bacterium]|nr:MAG: hypothetical protein COC23_03645 [Hyphomicrobiales bacterium]
MDGWAHGFLRCLNIEILRWICNFPGASIASNNRRCGVLHFFAFAVDFDAVWAHFQEFIPHG